MDNTKYRFELIVQAVHYWQGDYEADTVYLVSLLQHQSLENEANADVYEYRPSYSTAYNNRNTMLEALRKAGFTNEQRGHVEQNVMHQSVHRETVELARDEVNRLLRTQFENLEPGVVVPSETFRLKVAGLFQ